MDYKKIYNNIINKSIQSNRKKGDGILFENHHIIPKSLGGNNDKDNLVLLTPKEHYICHRLLVEIYKGTPQESKMYYAMWCMINGLGNQKRHATSSRIYNKLKVELKKIRSKVRYDNRKSIEQYDLEGNYIRTYDSPKTASIILGLNSSSIENCAREECKTSGGYNWKYVGSIKVIDKVDKKKPGTKQGNEPWNKGLKFTPGSININYKKVLKYSKEGLFIQEYDTIHIAAQSINASRSSIENCCLEKCKTAGGYNWKYKGSNKKILPITYEKPGAKKGSVPWNKKPL